MNRIKKIFDLMKKIGPNRLILIDIVLIMLIFTIVNKYMQITKPTYGKQQTEKFEYTAKINRHTFAENEIMIINLEIKNRKRKEEIIEINSRFFPNFDIYKDDKIVYRKDYLELKRKEKKKIRLGGYGKINFGTEWSMECDGEVKKVLPGKYRIRVWDKNINLDITIPFNISEGEI